MIRRITERVFKWGTWSLVAAFAVCLILLQLGIISDPLILAGIGSGILAGIVALLTDVGKSLDRIGEAIHRLERSAWKLRPLQECQADLLRILQRSKATDSIVVQHLGLDMSQAWPRLQDMLHKDIPAAAIELRILMVTDNIEETGAIPEAMRHWCSRAKSSLEEMRLAMKQLEDHFQNRARPLTIEVRQYKEVPAVHGFAVVQPFSAYYFTFCRWQAGSFRWGEDCYRCIEGHRKEDPSLQDMIEIFEGAFAHFWETGESVIRTTMGGKRARRVTAKANDRE